MARISRISRSQPLERATSRPAAYRYGDASITLVADAHKCPAIEAIALLALLCSPAPSVGATAPRCKAKNLILQHIDARTAGSFKDPTDLALRNTGPATCALTGFPRVRLLDGHGRAMPIGIRRIHSWQGVRLPVRMVLPKTWQPAYLSVFYTGGGPSHPTHRLRLRDADHPARRADAFHGV